MYVLTGNLSPPGLIGQYVRLLDQSGDRPVMDNLVTIQFVYPKVVAQATDGKFGYYSVRVPPSCLKSLPPRTA